MYTSDLRFKCLKKKKFTIYDLCKYVNTFKARSLTSVNKHNPTYGTCYCGMRYFLFLLQLIWPRRFYLARDMTNIFSFIQGSLE